MSDHEQLRKRAKRLLMDGLFKEGSPNVRASAKEADRIIDLLWITERDALREVSNTLNRLGAPITDNQNIVLSFAGRVEALFKDRELAVKALRHFAWAAPVPYPGEDLGGRVIYTNPQGKRIVLHDLERARRAIALIDEEIALTLTNTGVKWNDE